jgi:hypothetical protein
VFWLKVPELYSDFLKGFKDQRGFFPTPVCRSNMDEDNEEPIPQENAITPTDTPAQSETVAPLPQSVDPPPWFDMIMESISTIDTKVTLLDKKISSVNEQVRKLDLIETKINIFDKETSDIDASLKNWFEETIKLTETLPDGSDSLEFGLRKLEDPVENVDAENQKLRQDIVDLKLRSMRDNLLFSNIPEIGNETPKDTEVVLRQFLKDNMKMEETQVNGIKFNHVHRIAGPRTPRVIVAKFNEHQQR